MTVAGKQIAQAFYSKAPSHAYFSGCSTGGQQALSEAQLYPSGLRWRRSPARRWSTGRMLHAAFVWEPPGGGSLGRAAALGPRQAHAAQEGGRRGLQSQAQVGLASDTFVADPLHCVVRSGLPCLQGLATRPIA